MLRQRLGNKVWLLLALVGSGALWLFGCNADSPTAPQAPAPPPPRSTPASSVWSITVSISPNPLEVEADGIADATVNVSVRRASDGTFPPDNATIALATSLGTLTASGVTGTAIVVGLDRGQGVAALSVPATGEGSFVVQARLEDSLGEATVQIRGIAEEERFFVGGVTPNNGPPSGGRATITGGGFLAPVEVFFGTRRANVVSVSLTSIVVDVPPVVLSAGQTQTVAVQVRTRINDPAESQSGLLTDAFTYSSGVNVPSVTSLSPTSGPNEGGTRVSIFGEGFSSSVQVLFGTSIKIEAQVLNVTPTRIDVQTPGAVGNASANANNVVAVEVINLDSGLRVTFPAAFQFGNPQGILITSMGPGEGPYLGGTVVQFFGRGFDEPVSVRVGGVAVQPTSVTGSEVVARTSPVVITACQDRAGPSGITNIETGETAVGPDFVYRVIDPQIFSISPASFLGSTGSRALSIFGRNFVEPMRVIFGFPDGDRAVGATLSGTIRLINGTRVSDRLETSVPTLTEFPTEACDAGNGESGERFVPVLVDVEVQNLDTACTDTLVNALEIRPEDTSCRLPSDPPPPPPGNLQAAFSVTSTVTNPGAGTATVTFLNTSGGGVPPLSSEWFFGDGSSVVDNNQTVTHTYTGLSGGETFTVTLQVTDNTGQMVTLQQTITIPAFPAPPPPPPPPPPVNLTSSFTITSVVFDAVAQTAVATFLNNSTGGTPPLTSLWFFGDGTSVTDNGTTVTHTYTGVTGGESFTVTLRVDDSAGNSNTSQQTVNVP